MPQDLSIGSDKWLGAVRQQAITWARSILPYGVTTPQRGNCEDDVV